MDSAPNLPSKDAIASLQPILPMMTPSTYTPYYGTPFNYNGGGASGYFPSYPRSQYSEPYGMTSRLEMTTRPVMTTIETILQTLYNFTTMMDSAYFTGISSIHLLGQFYESFRVSRISQWIQNLLKANIQSTTINTDLNANMSKSTRTVRRKLYVGLVTLFVLIGLFKLAKKLSEYFLSLSLKEESWPNRLVPLPKPLFAKAIYDFAARDTQDLGAAKGTLLAIIEAPQYYLRYDTINPENNSLAPQVNTEKFASEPAWLKVRNREGQIGLFPSNYLSIIQSHSKSNA